MTYNVDIAHTARSQKLPPAKLVKFLIAAEGGSLAKELHRAGIDTTPAAVSQRRNQIPPAVFHKVFLSFTSSSAYRQQNNSYKGYRVLACDGTAINMARDPSAPSFVCNNSVPKGYNQLHLSPLFDIYDLTSPNIYHRRSERDLPSPLGNRDQFPGLKVQRGAGEPPRETG